MYDNNEQDFGDEDDEKLWDRHRDRAKSVRRKLRKEKSDRDERKCELAVALGVRCGPTCECVS